jgi:outer membrane autotransporter protein
MCEIGKCAIPLSPWDEPLRPSIAKRKTLAAGAALALSLLAAPAAFADSCVGDDTIGVIFVGGIGGMAASVAGGIQSGITTAQTAFLTQSSAFVSSPGNPRPDQQGSGVWLRAVGGQVDLQNPSSTTVRVDTTIPGLAGTGSTKCDSTIRTKFSGVQVGHDVARLNLDGWNIHLGTTAGYIEARSQPRGGNSVGLPFNSTVQSPFAGTYLVLTKGGFFADALLRFEHYEMSFNSPSFGINNQSLNARGMSVAASAGYHYSIPDTRHFVEPSVGVVASRTKVDAFNHGGATSVVAFGFPIPAAFQVNDIESVIGRAGIRFGTTVDAGEWILQPFAAASIWHEFAGDPTATYRSDHLFLCATTACTPFNLTATYAGSNVGTYGQYSLGVSAQLVNTGWVAFARGDYRKGNRLEGWDATGGVRYHFAPEPAVALVGKSPVYKASSVVAAAHNWSGFYMGLSGGAAFARARMSIDTSINGVPAGALTPEPRGAGFVFGGQFGYNWQFNPQWVGGIEGTFDLTNMNGAKECNELPNFPFNSTIPPAGDRNALYNTTCHFDSHWMATLTARLGYVWGRALWYVKAGAAFTRESLAITCNLAVVGGVPCAGTALILPEVIVTNPANDLAGDGTATLNRIGFTAGYGVEFALTPTWSARAETNYYGFGNKTVTLSNGVVVNSKYEVISTKIGVNHKLSN